ncbi:Calcium/proton exchanger [Punctularia strigosozonata HHB-11173 SS5]|uniref:Calcium/proton exchanger n=1 Tax=Punctularia strigosozonata (strain HHB-11173) TaxID=741275 RepID=R7S3N1_PUNST|nr:Calcium/proton exchanger [Punctularia strigosozonata HHB-11173 SS5]EIN04808.1 Calcium/proton exchanger [Punctularia strigosozonata HHB-11173 SS5]
MTMSSPESIPDTSTAEHSAETQTQAQRRTTFDHPASPDTDSAVARRRGAKRDTTETVRSNGAADGIPEQSRNKGPLLTRIATAVSLAAKPERPVGEAPGFWQGLRAVVFASWLNLLLVFIPISWAFNFAKPDSHTLIFVFSFLAIIPLAKLLAFATDEMSMRFGQTIAGLMNATLGNAVELIVAIIALTKCQIQVVQASLVGSILSNLLLVLGMCFFAGGTRFSEQGFGLGSSQINSSLLTLSVIAVLLPAAFDLSIRSNDTPDSNEKQDILNVSHGVAVILLFIYGAYLVFQLWSHVHLYNDGNDDVRTSTRYVNVHRPQFMHMPHRRKNDSSIPLQEAGADATDVEAAPDHEEVEEETPQMSMLLSIVVLAIVTVLVAVTAEWLVDSIDGLTEGGGISKTFVGLVLLPIVGNAAEHVTAVTVAVKDKLTLSIGVAVGSSIQIALFVIPFMIVLAWILGKPLSLLFDPFESIALFLAVITVNYVVADGKSNWLEGLILMSLYLILAVAFWFYIPATGLTC